MRGGFKESRAPQVRCPGIWTGSLKSQPCSDQAWNLPLALATWEAMASISGGLRQS